jgi:hypothetical protein
MFIRARVSITCPLIYPTKMDKNNIEFISIVKWKNQSTNLREVEKPNEEKTKVIYSIV